MTDGNGDSQDIKDEYVAYCGECEWSITAATEADAMMLVNLHVATAHAKKDK